MMPDCIACYHEGLGKAGRVRLANKTIRRVKLCNVHAARAARDPRWGMDTDSLWSRVGDPPFNGDILVLWPVDLFNWPR
jgi:hypothetical protein